MWRKREPHEKWRGSPLKRDERRKRDQPKLWAAGNIRKKKGNQYLNIVNVPSVRSKELERNSGAGKQGRRKGEKVWGKVRGEVHLGVATKTRVGTGKTIPTQKTRGSGEGRQRREGQWDPRGKI